MKRALCLVLALVLILALGMPAAAESAEEQLKRVTLRVKTTLDIGDDYDSFNGDSYTLEAELPGFQKEDIAIDIDGDQVDLIKGDPFNSDTVVYHISGAYKIDREAM